MNKLDVKKQRGQFFTKNTTVQSVLVSLLKNTGDLLEPSVGAGHLLKAVENLSRYDRLTGYELDPSIPNVSHTRIIYGDFFKLSKDEDGRYDSIIGNPPFVAWKNVENTTKKNADFIKCRYQDKTNLYHLFIDRCIDLLKEDGELVFIVPKEWLYSTSAAPLRKKISETGSLTHLIDCGEEKLFSDASVPALLIFRYQKSRRLSGKVKYSKSLNNAAQGVWERRILTTRNGMFLILSECVANNIKGWIPLEERFSVKVGIVSGLERVFKISQKCSDFEEETLKDYITTKGIETYIDVNNYDTFESIPEHTRKFLERHKDELLSRGIASFNENNFWKYGAIRNKSIMEGNRERFYVFVKTRKSTPFFEDDRSRLFSGGILGIFKNTKHKLSISLLVAVLNSPRYHEILEAMFLITGNKSSFQPSTLENIPIPPDDDAAKEWLKGA